MEAKILGNCSRENLLKHLSEQLKPKRVQHILGVEKMAEKLAVHYDADVTKCRTAALYHDIAKSLSLEKSLEILEKYHKNADEIESESTNLLHSKVGALQALHEYGIIDEEVLDAISFHTTGRENMSLVEKIIFVADAIEENRSYDHVDELREEAFVNLDHTLLRILRSRIITRFNILFCWLFFFVIARQKVG